MSEEIVPQEQKPVIRNEKGQVIKGSGAINPNGRPPLRLCLTDLLKKALEDESRDWAGKTNAEVLMEVLLNMGTNGDMKAIDTILHRVDGAVKQTIAIEDNTIQVTYETDPTETT